MQFKTQFVRQSSTWWAERGVGVVNEVLMLPPTARGTLIIEWNFNQLETVIT